MPLETVSDPPPFQLDKLPEWGRDYCQALATATQTPPDLAGLLWLAIAAGGLAKKYRVRIRAGWVEPLNLYCVTALPPGDRKSAVFTEMLSPVQGFQVEEQSGPAGGGQGLLEERGASPARWAAHMGSPTFVQGRFCVGQGQGPGEGQFAQQGGRDRPHRPERPPHMKST